MTIKRFVLCLYVISICFTFMLITPAIFAEKTHFNVGLKIVDFEYKSSDGEKEILTTAIWYPTDEQPASYTYKGSAVAAASRVAVDAPIAKGAQPYPLVFFIHGYGGSGISTAFFTELLASRGYIVVGPDYIETIPPDFKEQAAMERIEGGNIVSAREGINLARQFVQVMDRDRQKCIRYINKYRIRPSHFIIDKMLEMNRDRDSFFYQAIDEEAIGMFGWSLGGVATLGLAGAYPEERDSRIKAALLFSPATYPFEDNIQDIDIPMMVMMGDNDPAHLQGPNNAERTLAYYNASQPKYLLVVKNGRHMSFGNRACLRGGSLSSLEECRQSTPQSQVISRYGLAFFDKYLKKDAAAQEQLDESGPALAYYIKEEKPGEEIEWGEMPPPAENRQQEIRGKIRQRIRERLRNRGGGSFGQWQ